MSRQLRQRSRGTEGNSRFANEVHFAFCLRSCWVSLWTSESEVSVWAFFYFLKFVMNFLKGVVSICHSFRSTGPLGRINGFDRCFQVVDRYTAQRRLYEKSLVLIIQYLSLARPLCGLIYSTLKFMRSSCDKSKLGAIELLLCL